MPRGAFQDNEPSHGPTLSEIARTCGCFMTITLIHCIGTIQHSHVTYEIILLFVIEMVGQLSYNVYDCVYLIPLPYMHCHFISSYDLIVST